jgi:hypothetical protein
VQHVLNCSGKACPQECTASLGTDTSAEVAKAAIPSSDRQKLRPVNHRAHANARGVRTAREGRVGTTCARTHGQSNVQSVIKGSSIQGTSLRAQWRHKFERRHRSSRSACSIVYRHRNKSSPKLTVHGQMDASRGPLPCAVRSAFARRLRHTANAWPSARLGRAHVSS